MFPCEIQSGMKAPCQWSHTIPIPSRVITSRTAPCYINAGQRMLAMKAGLHYQILYPTQSLTSFTLDPVTCASVFISITLQRLLDQCFEFTVHIWWLLLYWSHQFQPPNSPCIFETQWRRSYAHHKDRESFLEMVKMETELYPYNPILRWLSPQIIIASLLLVPNLMSACTHLGYRGALFSNATLIKGGNHFQWAVLTGNMRGHLYLKILTHWMPFRSTVVDTTHKAQSNWGLHNST